METRFQIGDIIQKDHIEYGEYFLIEKIILYRPTQQHKGHYDYALLHLESGKPFEMSALYVDKNYRMVA